MNSHAAAHSPTRVTALAIMMCLALLGVIFTVSTAAAQDDGVVPAAPVVASASSLSAANQAAERNGATVIGIADAGHNLFIVQGPPDVTSSDFAITMANDVDVEWAVPETAKVHANPFYAWNDPGVHASPFYAWSSNVPIVDAIGIDVNLVYGLPVTHAFVSGSGVTVAVIDTGFNVSHPLLTSRLLPGADFVDGDSDVSDEPNALDDDGDGFIDEAIGHGTHVAGIVAQVAPGAEIIPIRALDSDGVGSVHSVLAALQFAFDHDADIINLSFGTDIESPALQMMLDDAESRGIVVVAAAGNEGLEDAQIPARYPQVISVAAHGYIEPGLAPFSNYGDLVDVSAIGVSVRSADRGSGTITMTGTSAASPVVAGQVALLMSGYPSWGHDAVRAHVRNTAALPLATDRNSVHGRVQVGASLQPTLFGTFPDLAPPSTLQPEPIEPNATAEPNEPAEPNATPEPNEPNDPNATAEPIEPNESNATAEPNEPNPSLSTWCLFSWGCK